MLKRLHLRNFTVFEDADFEFGPGLNVVVGTNGTGKSHVLKVAYVALYSFRERLERMRQSDKSDDKTQLPPFPYDRLSTVFRPIPSSASLIRHSAQPLIPPIEGWDRDPSLTKALTKIEAIIDDPGGGGSYFTDLTSSGTSLSGIRPAGVISSSPKLPDPAFIPAKEVLTAGWLLPLYDRREIPIDETYPDLLRLLMGPPLRQPEPAHIVEKLRQLIGGKVEEEGGHFYLSAPDQPRLEMNMVAEGMRKFATLYKLLANGTLTPDTTLFWDEPEANLNPALLREMAAVLAELARAGFQIILATHSLFLLKELHILSQKEKTAVRYFGLSAEAGGPTRVATADSLTDLPDLVALDVEMAQSDTFLDVLNQADANL